MIPVTVGAAVFAPFLFIAGSIGAVIGYLIGVKIGRLREFNEHAALSWSYRERQPPFPEVTSESPPKNKDLDHD